MKYDSGMTSFHDDILKALQYMLGNNSEITEKFSPNDGSPAPLRDYLKEKYGKSYTSHIGAGMRYSCKTSTGFELTFDTILNYPGYKNLTLSWSQVAKFIRDNWDEVFKKTKPKSRPLETLVRTFDEAAMTCPNWVKGKTLTYLEMVNGVHFECKAFSMEFCKLDDITSFFVKHCNCPENCPYCKETAEKQPSYLDKLREKYPKISIEDDWVWDLYCPSDLFLNKNIPDSCNDFCMRNKTDKPCLECWNSPCAANVTFGNDNLDMFEQYPAEDTAEADAVPEISEDTAETDKLPENQIATTTETALQSAFDYSELDSDTADKLRAVSERVISIKATYIIETAKQVKAAHDLLANHYKGLWGAWCESVGFTRQTGNNLIHVAETFPDLMLSNAFDNISARLLYEASKPSAPKELVEQVKNGDITTHKEYIALKKQLEEANKRAETAEQNNEKNAAKLAAEAAKADELLSHIKELESRPVDVAVQRDETSLAEIARLKDELAKAQQDIIDASFKSGKSGDTELVSEFYETLHGSALSAIRSCADFAEKNGSKFTSRFRSLAEVINDYINEMEEF